MKRALIVAFVCLSLIIAHIPMVWVFYFLYFNKEGTGGIADAVFNALLIVLWGIIHSLLARDFAKKYLAKIVGGDYVIIVYTLISGITFFSVLYFWRPLKGILWQTDGLLYVLITILFVVCMLCMLYAVTIVDYLGYLGAGSLLRKVKNEPAKQPEINVSGFYAYCRHPFYLFFLLALWIAPVMTYGRFEFAIFGSVYLFIGAKLEEGNLREELGEDYDLYRENVPMWIPRLTPWKYKQ